MNMLLESTPAFPARTIRYHGSNAIYSIPRSSIVLPITLRCSAMVTEGSLNPQWTLDRSAVEMSCALQMRHAFCWMIRRPDSPETKAQRTGLGTRHLPRKGVADAWAITFARSRVVLSDFIGPPTVEASPFT